MEIIFLSLLIAVSTSAAIGFAAVVFDVIDDFVFGGLGKRYLERKLGLKIKEEDK